jgi:hypothetical protein
MRVLYIAGPYRADSIQAVKANIERAGEYALRFWLRGWAVICPHKNSALFDGLSDKICLAGYIEILKRCDAVFAMPGWKKSKGATAEIKEAKRLGIEIIYK